jgi:hypothetical protein
VIAWVEILVTCYLPALVVVLLHPNVSVGLLPPFEAIPSTAEAAVVER